MLQRAHEGSGGCPSRIFVESERDLLSGSDGVGIHLGNWNIYAQSTDRGEVKQLFSTYQFEFFNSARS